MILAGTQRRAFGPGAKRHLPLVPERLASADVWSEEVFGRAQLGDPRRTDRLVQMAAVVAGQPTDSLPQACPTWAQTKGAYRLLENEAVSVEAVIQCIGQATARFCTEMDIILVVQDTTALSFPKASSLKEMGYSNTLDVPTLHAHSSLALREDGVAIGLTHLKLWSRDPLQKGKSKQRDSRPIEEKESFKWLEGIRGTRAAFAKQNPKVPMPQIIHLFDREGDVHEVFAEILEAGERAVIRQEQNRTVLCEPGEERLACERLRAQNPLGRVQIDVPRKGGQGARQATLTLRACSVTLSSRRSDLRKTPPVTLNLVEALEEQPPAGAEALHWVLWTTESAESLEQALRVVRLYKQRWKIEDYHRTLKSGCRVEDLRLHTEERIRRAVAIYAPVAVRIVQLRDLARQEPDAPCTQVLSDLEWRALHARIHNQVPDAKVPVPSLRQAVLWIGRLGGHLGRKGDGMPGAQTLWRGLRDLQIMLPVYALIDYSPHH